jgi:molybdate transport system permease protein
MGPLALSCEVALVATTASLLVGVPLAAWLARDRGTPGMLLDAALAIPLVLPPTVIGYALLASFGRRSALGQAIESIVGEPVVFTPFAAMLAATVSALPLVVRSARAAFEEVERSAIEAAYTLGAGAVTTFLRVELPLAWRGVAAGATLGFARALGDFGATLLFAGGIPGETETASIALYHAVQAGRDDDALRLITALALLATVPVVATSLLARKHATRTLR